MLTQDPPKTISLSERIRDVTTRLDRITDTVFNHETPTEILWPKRREKIAIPRRITNAPASVQAEFSDRVIPGLLHDLNNMLAVMSGHTELLEMEVQQSSAEAKHLAVIRMALGKISALTKRLQSVTKPESGLNETLDLVHVIVELKPLIKAITGPAIELVVMVPSEPLMIFADRVMIERMILNLVINARDAMPDGGSIGIRAARINKRSERSDGNPKPHVALTVADTGPGIEPAIRSRIFEPYFTTKGSAGTGLGLSNVKEIVNRHSGSIDVHSDPDIGTVFRIELPQRVDFESEFFVPVHYDWSAHDGLTALVVDDDERIRTSVKSLLERVGYNVIESANAESALRLTHVTREPIDLLVTDLVMPGMGGRNLMERMRCSRPGLPTLLISGYSDSIGEAEPSTRFLLKPFANNHFYRVIHEVMNTFATA